MSAADLIHQAETRGVRLWAEGAALRYRGNPEALHALLPELKTHKAALLRLLAEKPAEAREDEHQHQAHPEPTRAPTGSTQAHAGLSGPARCCDCQHQQPTDHPALILCGAGRESPAACGAWWKFDPRYCGQFARATA
jgi:hypothetical protein